MSYNIRKTDDELLISLGEEVIDTETVSGIGLIGRLTPNYGETQSNNFIHILENFASTKFPKNPLVGQLCYKKNRTNDKEGSLYVCVNNIDGLSDSVRWKKVPSVIVADRISETAVLDTGDMWYDTKEKAFKIYDAELGEWLSVGPDNFNYTDEIIDVVSSDDEIVYLGNYDFNGNHNKYNSSYLITAKIVAKEVPQVLDTPLSNSFTTAWIFNLLVSSRLVDSTSPIVCDIIDEPDYQLIGTNVTDELWSVEPTLIDDETGLKTTVLRFKCKGKPKNSSNKISWTIKMDILKVN